MKAYSIGSGRRILRRAAACLVVCSVACYLAPVSQPLSWNKPTSTAAHKTGLVQLPVEGKSQHPELRWKGLTYKHSTVDDFGEEHHVRLTGYDLLIFDEDGDIVYRRIRIPTPAHVVEQRLEGPAEYTWTVRPRYEVDGLERVGMWSQARAEQPEESIQIIKHEVPIPRSKLARFEVGS